MKSIKIDKDEDVCVVTVPYSVQQGDYIELKKYLEDELYINGDVNILIDCEPVVELPSLAFGVFCSIARDINRAGGQFGLVHVSTEIQDILKKTHLDKQIKSYNTISDAKQYFCINK